MRFVRLAALVFAIVTVTSGLSAQEATKKVDPKDPTKVEPKSKGFLPMNWSKLGLTDEQRNKVYGIQGKYNDEIEKLEAQIKTLKDKMTKERLEVLTAEQKKRLQDILLGKAGTSDK